MFRARRARWVATVHAVSRRAWIATALVCGLTLAGCAGQADLSKTVANRTTVKATSAFGDEALRTVDPCKLFTDDVLNSIGQKKTEAVTRTGYSECGTVAKNDAGDKDITVTVKIGDDLFAAPKQFGKHLSGLGVYETRTSTGCTMSAVTGREPDRGITVLAVSDGAGDPCAAATKMMEATVKTLASNPPRYESTPGSLVALDACAGMDDSVATTVLGAKPTKIPFGVHACTFQNKQVTAFVRYTIDFDPFSIFSSSRPAKVEVSDKVKNAAQWRDSISPKKCQIAWVHREVKGNRGENVMVAYERMPADESEDICAKALAVAKGVAGKLPSA